MTTSTVIYQDANETITLVTNGDTVPPGQPGYYRTYTTSLTPGSSEANRQQIQAAVSGHLAQVEAWLAANPTGAVLTAAQTAFLARMVVGVGRLILGMLDTTGQS